MPPYTLIEKILFFPVRFNADRIKQKMHGKTILITGASSGIGKELAYLLKDAHVQLILVARREDKLQQIKRDIESSAAQVSVFRADLRDAEDMAELLRYLHRFPNGLDIVVSNAGKSINRPIYQSLDRLHDFTRTMAINYTAPVELVLSVLPLLEKNNGHLVNVSTINALLHPIPYWAAYQASKAAFDTWFRSASPEWQARGISSTTLYFPLVRTPMIEPTLAYRTAPAMLPAHAARMIAESVAAKRKTYKPWWLIFGQLASVLFRPIFDMIFAAQAKKKERA
ncbi:SDR family NAD(P)-dependent oxidoreductase [Planococcus sp. YIM B11945]|uniref:SDR family NAD(P)-dependent oxidoreductase n=1 Tax=Planococcus sp. YIM B11945 TaxID=3435410 RepID=UPI003D7D3847